MPREIDRTAQSRPWWKSRSAVVAAAAVVVLAVIAAVIWFVSEQRQPEPNAAGLDACVSAAADELGVDVDDVDVFVGDSYGESETSFAPSLYVDGEHYSMLCHVTQQNGAWIVDDYSLF